MDDQNEPSSPPAKRHRQLRNGGRWSIQHVAQYLNCSHDHAIRWLREKGITLYDIGTGSKAIYRVERRDVLNAYLKARIDLADEPAPPPRAIGYVPRYFKPGWQGRRVSSRQ